MNNKRKVIIAAILFVFIGLTAFTFANPNDEENVLNAGSKNEVTNNNQVTDIFDNKGDNDDNNIEQNNTTPLEETNNNNEEVNNEDNSYQNALEAIVNAEAKMDKDSFDEASELLELVTTNKEELTTRLEELKNNLDVKLLVEALETMTNEATNKENINEARTYRIEENVDALVAELTNEILKEELTTRLSAVAKVLDDEALELNIADNAIFKENTKIEIEDDNELVITLTVDGVSTVIENGEELTDGIYTLTVVDKAFNEETITFTIDTQAPVLTIVEPEIYELESGQEYVEKGYSAYDAIDEDVTNLIVQKYEFKETEADEFILVEEFDNNKVGIYKITYTAYDKAGNSSEGTREVKFADTIAPVIQLPGTAGASKNELIVEAGTKVTYEDLLAMVEDVTADDFVAPHKADLLISGVASENKYNITDFTNGLDTNYVGRYNVEYTITDKGGNTTTATMLLVMKDTISPVIKLPGTSGLNKNELIVEAGTKVTYEDLIALVEDATANKQIAPYSASLLISSNPEENTYNIKDFTNGLNTNYVGRYNISYKVTDKGGNTTIATMLLVMKDTTAPVIKLPGTEGKAKNELNVEIGTTITYEDLLAMVEDATIDGTIAPYKADLLISSVGSENTYNIKDFTNGLDTNYVGRYNVYYKVTDKGGNTTTATMLLFMRDTEKPVLTAEVTLGRTYIRGTDKTHLQFNIYKDGELKHSFNSKTSESGKYFSLSTGWFGDGEYTIEAIDEGKNKTTIETIVISSELALLKYYDSIKLTKDATLEEILEILNGQDKTIDLNGHQLIVKQNESKPIQNSGKLTIKNGTIVNESSNKNGIIENKENSEITLDNITVTDKGTGTIIKNNGGKVVISNTEITSNNANMTVENISGDLTAKNTKITIKGINAYAFWIHNGNVLVENTDITAVRGGFNIYGGNITIDDVNVKLNTSGTTQSYYAIYVANKNDSNIKVNSGTFAGTRAGMYIDGVSSLTGKSNVEVNGGTFSSTKTTTAATVVSKGENAQVSLTIKGGKFNNTNITEYLAEGYKQNSDWTVELANELLLLKNNDSVKLTKDATLEEILKITNGQNKTIDLNGNKLIVKNTNDESKNALQNSGKLTIKNGTIVSESSNKNGLIENTENGTLILDDVKITNNGQGTVIKNNGGKVTITNTDVALQSVYAAVENNSGEMTIKETKITGSFVGKAYLAKINGGKVTVEDTTFTGPYGGLNIWGGTVTITNTNIKIQANSGTKAQHAIYIANAKDSKVVINSGTFDSRTSALCLHKVSGEGYGTFSVEVNGGTFSASANVKDALYLPGLQDVDLTIKGGKFTGDDVTAFLAEGYKQNSDWTVTVE